MNYIPFLENLECVNVTVTAVKTRAMLIDVDMIIHETLAVKCLREHEKGKNEIQFQRIPIFNVFHTIGG